MAQITITVSDDTDTLLKTLSESIGESKSSIASRCLENGLDELIERHNKRQVFRNLIDKSKKTKSEDQQ